MESVVFPQAFLDLPTVCDLPAEHKLILCHLAVHPRLSCCAVLAATPYVVAQTQFLPEVFWGVVADLERREILVFDQETSEIFLADSFNWHRAPQPDEDSGWARQVVAGLGRVRSAKVKEVVDAALSTPPAARFSTLKIPSNLLTAMPQRGKGLGWSASESLVYFSIFIDPGQTPAGVFTPYWPALGAFSSLPVQTVLECVDSLGTARLLSFDEGSGELFLPARLRAAGEREIGKIQKTAESIRSWSIFQTFATAAKRRFPKITLKSSCCALGEGKGFDLRGEEFPRNEEIGKKFNLRHGGF